MFFISIPGLLQTLFVDNLVLFIWMLALLGVLLILQLTTCLFHTKTGISADETKFHVERTPLYKFCIKEFCTSSFRLLC